MGNKSKKFTIGISYSKHLKKAKTTFQKIVLPQLESKHKIDKATAISKQKIHLSPTQKAHLNCQSPI